MSQKVRQVGYRVAVDNAIDIVKEKADEITLSNEISIGFYLGISNILGLLYALLVNNYII